MPDNSLPTAYPLQWPIARPRADSQISGNFRTALGGQPHSIRQGVHFVLKSLGLMAADDPVISSNLRVRLDGLPYSDQANPQDSGVAVYFHHKGKPVVFACDRYVRVEDNLWAIGLTLEALRGIDRWGAATLEATFTGYAALPAPAGGLWFEVLGVSARSTAADITAAYRAKAKELHPDMPGGSHEGFVRLKAAYESAVALGLVAGE